MFWNQKKDILIAGLVLDNHLSYTDKHVFIKNSLGP